VYRGGGAASLVMLSGGLESVKELRLKRVDWGSALEGEDGGRRGPVLKLHRAAAPVLVLYAAGRSEDGSGWWPQEDHRRPCTASFSSGKENEYGPMDIRVQLLAEEHS
jgi:hypothetical protein